MRVRLGYGSCGIAAGANAVLRLLKEAGIQPELVGCNGMCFAEPLVEVLMDDENVGVLYGHLTDKTTTALIAQLLQGELPLDGRLTDDEMHFLNGQTRIALAHCGRIDPESLASYEAAEGYFAFKNALTQPPEQILDTMRVSGLRGRGGAGFPTARKWQATRDAEGTQKVIVCNADEGDPGAFMDRSLLEGDPHAVLEGMMIAGLAVGAGEGILYVRAEYPLAVRRLEIAIEQLNAAGYLGENILGSTFSFTLRILKGAGAFVCGEETALLASLEGNRGMPRPKPPFPAQSGYFGHPTSINNVETLANVAWIMRNGGDAFASYGTDDAKGTKVFALAGKVKRGGLVEVPMGITLHEIVFGICGGIRDDKQIKGVQIGGPSGGCLPATLLDTPIEYTAIAKTGAIMGSGGLVVMDEDTCMVDMARFFMEFTSKESCGKCVPCRIGTVRMLEILNRIVTGKGHESDLDTLQNLGERIIEGSLCGLGMSAPNPVLTTLRYFKDEYVAHIEGTCCPAKACKALVRYRVIPENCKGCGVCAKKCPVVAISGTIRQPFTIDPALCTACGICKGTCRFNAIEKTSGEVLP